MRNSVRWWIEVWTEDGDERAAVCFSNQDTKRQLAYGPVGPVGPGPLTSAHRRAVRWAHENALGVVEVHPVAHG